MRRLDLPTLILLASEACVLFGWMEESTRVLPLKVGMRMVKEERKNLMDDTNDCWVSLQGV